MDKFSYVKKEDRKKVLLLCDDIRMHSGVATMAREIVMGTAQHFNWVNIGGAIKHPDEGKGFDLSQDVNKEVGIEDADVKLFAVSGYGTPDVVRQVMAQEKVDAILLFTDPRYWTWMFEMEREIRQHTPIFYLNIWDDYPTPNYNRDFYRACDLLMAISKQTKNINELVLGEEAKDKVIKYVPHGINSEVFYPINKKEEVEDLAQLRKDMFLGREFDFVVFWNSRNIRRKSPGDVILSYRHFCDKIGPEKASRCALVMHTAPVDNNGTDLNAVVEALGTDYFNVFFSANKLTPAQMNQLYNVADVTMLISSNEGWGLSLTESMMAGTPIIANVTGGMQDQMRFETEDGKWIEFSREFPSNHMGTIKKCGKWAKPVFPSNISMVGSVPTPYIHDDRADFRDVAEAIEYWYNMSQEERDEAGRAAREWVTSEESGMSSSAMCKNVIESMDEAFAKWEPRSRFDLYEAGYPTSNKITHPLVY